MPLYTYECSNCGVQFERLQKFADKPIKRCPECNKNAVKRVIQPAGIIFKGSGWYKTDSRSSSSAVTGGASNAKKSETKSESKSSESKPAESKSTESKSSSSGDE
ncbi:MAG TPA: FmdB family zinc ribbon protein [Anaerolineales bacterium]|nr:FmdB family zinc ribbon protein [Anaerolineales bacterium]